MSKNVLSKSEFVLLITRHQVAIYVYLLTSTRTVWPPSTSFR